MCVPLGPGCKHSSVEGKTGRISDYPLSQSHHRPSGGQLIRSVQSQHYKAC